MLYVFFGGILLILFGGVLSIIGIINKIPLQKDLKSFSNEQTNIETVQQNNEPLPIVQEAIVDAKYKNSINNLLISIINEELSKNSYNRLNEIKIVANRKLIITIVFSILNFAYICSIFFHLSKNLIIVEIINIAVYIIFLRKFDNIHYIIKQIKSRPTEKISYIVSSIIVGNNTSKKKNIIKILSIIFLSTAMSLLIFIKPHIFYEKVDDGYYVRFYTIGIINEKTITIPETYKGQKVVGIRGNVFANISTLEEINLPNSIHTIRGKAFLNDKNLKRIKLPSKLSYLGGSAFKNCTSLESITIPENVLEINGNTFEGCTSLKEINLHDKITSIHGEAFINCKSLKSIILPSRITEIRGYTFQGCTSLKSINIPEGVTRVGGHAFEDCHSLSSVKVPRTVMEIGSSAFRRCYSLELINIPTYTNVNFRAFKESPTQIIYE